MTDIREDAQALAASPAAITGTVTVWVFLDGSIGDSTASLHGTEAEAQARWREDAEELWLRHCGSRTPPTEDADLCAGLEEAGCTEWGTVEAHQVTLPAPADSKPYDLLLTACRAVMRCAAGELERPVTQRAPWGEAERLLVAAIAAAENAPPAAPPRPHDFDAAELGAILAGLRIIQRTGYTFGTIDIATEGGKFAPLDDDAIEELCQRINV